MYYLIYLHKENLISFFAILCITESVAFNQIIWRNKIALRELDSYRKLSACQQEIFPTFPCIFFCIPINNNKIIRNNIYFLVIINMINKFTKLKE